jgi:hypothetical protein
LGFEGCPTPSPTPSPHLVEDYQIAFFCDNFFLLGAADEITLAGLPYSEHDETPVSLED